MARSTRRPGLRLALCLAAALAGRAEATRAEPSDAAPAPPTIYKWVDANGIAHYTTDLGRVPRSVRGSVRALGGASENESLAARDASPAAAAPPATPAKPSPVPAEEWDEGSAAAAPAPAAAAPVAGAREPWAESDRLPELPGEDAAAPAPAAQTASSEPAAPSAPLLSPEERAGRTRELDARIAALEAEIASDEEALKGFLVAPAPEDPGALAYDRSFREVAERLPKRLAELRTLQSQRAQLERP